MSSTAHPDGIVLHGMEMFVKTGAVRHIPRAPIDSMNTAPEDGTVLLTMQTELAPNGHVQHGPRD